MRKIVGFIILISLFFGSCQFFDKQIPSKKELLDKEIKTIDWKKVDEYPSIGACDSLSDKTQKQHCFFDYLTSLIQEKLAVDTPFMRHPKLDTLNVKVTIFPNSTIRFETIFKDSLSDNNSKIDSILQAKLIDFPVINPAIKRGIPVKTQFVLPVILKVE